MIKKFKLPHIHWYKFSHRKGNNVYSECRCGTRRCKNLIGGYTPIDFDWLRRIGE